MYLTFNKSSYLSYLQNYDGLNEDIFVVYVFSFINISVWSLLNAAKVHLNNLISKSNGK